MRRLISFLVPVLVCGLTPTIDGLSSFAYAQTYEGPMLPHVGLEVTTSFHNLYGPDAEVIFEIHSRDPKRCKHPLFELSGNDCKAGDQHC